MGARAKSKPAAGGAGNRRKAREPKPWERQEGESLGAFEAFVVYRDMPARRLEGVSLILGNSKDTVADWLKKHNWTDRAEAWDAELDRRVREAEINAIKRMTERQVEIALGCQEVATLELTAMVDQVRKTEKRAKRLGVKRKPLLKARDIVRLVECGTKLERLNRGEPDSIVETRPEQERLEALDVDELVAYRHMLEKMRALK